MSYPRRFQVLVVDDEPGMRETLVDILEQSGYVSAAADGDDALDVMQNRDVDIVVMDVQMPTATASRFCSSCPRRRRR